MSVWDVVIDGAKGLVSGAATGLLLGGPVGAIIGGAVGAGAGSVEGYYVGEAKDKMIANQKKSAAETQHINETIARRQARGAYEAAMSNPAASSDAMFTKAALQRQADGGWSGIRDKGNPFTPANDKTEKRQAVAPQFYGKAAKAA